MSIILDALKKSESDRQRQTGPALFEVKVAPPKARFPTWAVAIVALLVINMCIVGWLVLRHSSRGEEVAATTTSPAPANTVARASGNAAPAASPPVERRGAADAPAGAGPRAQGDSSPPSNQQSLGRSEPRLPQRDQDEPTLAAGARAPNRPNTDAEGNPDDFAPATEPGSPLFKGHVRRGTESGLPLYQDAALVPGADLPQLRLDLHVYAARPQDRFALINMHKLHEGDSVQNGILVESITPDGVVMSHNGSKFLLPRE